MYKVSLPLVALIVLGAATAVPTTTVFAEETTTVNEDWWPNRIDLSSLRQNNANSSPLGEEFNYAEEFAKLDLDAVKHDLIEVMTTSQDWWPADYGHYGPFFIRQAWHSSGTYRTFDGRGGAGGGLQRFAPLNSWPDNGNLDKAQRLLWPLKQKYGNAISWSDMIVLAGTVAMESMGFNTLGFAGGREDAWQPENVNWGIEKEWLAAQRFTGDRELDAPLAAVRMGLIYVNPEGPNGVPDPLLAARDIRITFGRMAMDDEETVALIAGGHTFGKAHGAASPEGNVGPEPEAAGIEEQGLGWKNSYGSGKGADTITSGLEGAWTPSPVEWTHSYLEMLYSFNWVQTRSPAGAIQWIPEEDYGQEIVPDAHRPDIRHAPIMFTTDIALKEDPEFRKITTRWLENPEEFEAAFARAWFKLTHRDMGPRSRYLGSFVPSEAYAWQDPIPEVDHKLVSNRDIAKLKTAILDSGLSVSELVRTAWASASSFRGTDMRGGANGARLRLEPQINWAINDGDEIGRVLTVLESIQSDFNNRRYGSKRVSLADLIVLGGSAAVEKAAADAGVEINIPFKAGRMDASQEMTDVQSFGVLEPMADGFRNYLAGGYNGPSVELLVDKASTLNLNVPEMTVLIGGLRVLGANASGVNHGLFTEQTGVLSNDFFVNLLNMSTVWSKSSTTGVYEGRDRVSGDLKWTATDVDLIFGSNTELRAVAEVYAMDGAKAKFVSDFVNAWTKVMTLDRFDLQ